MVEVWDVRQRYWWLFILAWSMLAGNDGLRLLSLWYVSVRLVLFSVSNRIWCVMMMMPTFGAFAFQAHSFFNVSFLFSTCFIFSYFFLHLLLLCFVQLCASVFVSFVYLIAISLLSIVSLFWMFAVHIVWAFHCKFYMTSIFFVSCSNS